MSPNPLEITNGVAPAAQRRRDRVSFRVDDRDRPVGAVRNPHRAVGRHCAVDRLRTDLTVATTFAVAASTRATVPPATSAAQTSVALAASHAGALPPVAIRVTAFVAGSMRKIDPPAFDPTQTAPPAKPSPAGQSGRRFQRGTQSFLEADAAAPDRVEFVAEQRLEPGEGGAEVWPCLEAFRVSRLRDLHQIGAAVARMWLLPHLACLGQPLDPGRHGRGGHAEARRELGRRQRAQRRDHALHAELARRHPDRLELAAQELRDELAGDERLEEDVG